MQSAVCNEARGQFVTYDSSLFSISQLRRGMKTSYVFVRQSL